MTVLGIDPGSVVTGYGLVSCDRRRPRLLRSGCLRPPRRLSFAERLVYLHDGTIDLVRTHAPDQAALEAVFHGANVETLIKMCHARGTILMALGRAGVPVFEYSPREIKKSVVGNGNASKEQVAFMVGRLLRQEEGEAFDESDGISAALCHANRQAFRGQPSGGCGRSLTEKLIDAGADPDAALRAGRSGRRR